MLFTEEGASLDKFYKEKVLQEGVTNNAKTMDAIVGNGNHIGTGSL